MATPPDALVLAGDAPSPAPSDTPARGTPRLASARPPRLGWRVVAVKEFGDGILSIRLFILIALLGLAAVGAIYSTASFVGQNAQAASGTSGLFVLLFSHQATGSQVPSFAALVGLLGPLLGIAFGFDAINGERSERTLPRLVSQPIHRDAVIIGKFAAGLTVIGLVLLAITPDRVRHRLPRARHQPQPGRPRPRRGMVRRDPGLPGLLACLRDALLGRRAPVRHVRARGDRPVDRADDLLGAARGHRGELRRSGAGECHARPADRQRPAPAGPRPGLAGDPLLGGRGPTCWTRRSRPWASCRSRSRRTSGRSRRSCRWTRACCLPGRRRWRSSP
jgi:hypothetical protein